MKKKSLSPVIFSLILALFVLSAGCKTVPPVIPEDLTAAQIFQKAQEAADSRRWDNSAVYYRTFMERYPDDLPNILAARYELAFIEYKKGNYEEATKGFQDLLDDYGKIENQLTVPQWPRVLSEKLIGIIEEKTRPLIEIRQ